MYLNTSKKFVIPLLQTIPLIECVRFINLKFFQIIRTIPCGFAAYIGSGYSAVYPLLTISTSLPILNIKNPPHCSEGDPFYTLGSLLRPKASSSSVGA